MRPLLQWKRNEYYTTRVCVVLGIQHAMRVHQVVICGLLRSAIFFHIINGTIFEKKMLLNIKFMFRVSLQILSETFSFYEEMSEI